MAFHNQKKIPATGVSATARGVALVLLAATLWATMGLFYASLMGEYGLSRLTVIFWRALVAAVALTLSVRLTAPGELRRLVPHWPLYLGFGLIGTAAFYVCYITAIDLTGMGIAAALMYTAPIWVLFYAVVVEHEHLSWRRVVAVILALGGCVGVSSRSGLLEPDISAMGVTMGLLAGITYGAYILFSRAAATRNHSPWAAMSVALVIGSLALLPFQTIEQTRLVLTTPGIIGRLLILGLLPTLGGGVAFNASLRTLSASRASIIATIEPVVAMGLGWLMLAESIGWAQVIGVCLIVGAIVILHRHLP